MRSPTAFLMGFATAYFFDPQLGTRRRNVARDRAAKAARNVSSAFAKKLRFTAGKAEGVYALTRNVVTRPEVAADDATVEQRIRSEAFRTVDVQAKDIEVEVENGVATLRGSVPSDQLASDLVESVRKVAGVENVQPLLSVQAEGERDPA
jgi:osmotically-inducible protein OsmY